MRPIPQLAVDFIAQHEGCRLQAYQDGAGVWTIGYGSTQGVKPGDTITQDEAKAKLRSDLQVTAERLEARIGAIANDLTVHQYAALLSFVFNVGAGASWTIWKRLKARQFDQIPLELMKFTNAGGKKVQGLVNRRADECKLWATEEPGSTAQVLPSSVTRSMPTPPTVSDPVPPQKSAQVLTLVGAVAAGVPVAVGQVSTAISPYAAQSELLQRVLSTLAVIAAFAVVAGLAIAWMKKREARQ